jgi:ribose transport system ATP-binding protein
MNAPPLLEMRGMAKRFPGVNALSGVSLEVRSGEVVALCGENGAGKSTLMKILGGVYQPDEGEILIEGRPVRIGGVKDAIALGVAFIHQELNILDNLDVAANVFLGREPRSGPFRLIDQGRIHADTAAVLRRIGLEVPTHARLDTLSLAQQQMVEIAKALSLNARMIIMDEPTSCLTLKETDRLLALIADLRKAGVSVIYISHRLGEISQCADRAVVLRDGRNAGELRAAEITHDRIVNLMVGRDLKPPSSATRARSAPVHLEVRDLRTARYPDRPVSFDAAKGEILGVAGLIGAGRSEVAKALLGLDPEARGTVRLGGAPVSLATPQAPIQRGLCLVPEDRRGEGLVTAMTVRENITLPSLPSFASLFLIQRRREIEVAEAQVTALRIKTPSVETLALNLSGGNQQKIVLGKWLARNPEVLILDEPTRGIDVGAKGEIYRLMRELADRGAVILTISSDMEEVLHVSDRIMVMHEGRITGVLDRPDCTEQNVMQLAVGRSVPAARPPVPA